MLTSVLPILVYSFGYVSLVYFEHGFHRFLCFSTRKTPYDVRISDWSSDVCSSDLPLPKKSAALLAYLARRPGQPHEREKLATLLWTEAGRSDERRVGKECVSRCRSRRSRDH